MLSKIRTRLIADCKRIDGMSWVAIAFMCFGPWLILKANSVEAVTLIIIGVVFSLGYFVRAI